MRALLPALLISATPALAITPIQSTPAISEAVRTGEIIGGAMACGASEARVLAVARRVIHRIRGLALAGDDLHQVQSFHEQAVTRAAERIKAGEGNCGEALSSFAELEAQKP
jgi:hypothetical protein